MGTDVYFKKVIPLRYGGRVLQFRVAHDLFSSHDIDQGTRMLLRSLDGENRRFASALDLGCGYGAIGLAMRAAGHVEMAHMVDRDALALDYARQNAQLNSIDGVEIYGSLGYDDVPAARFDLIVSNIPGKAGEPVISHLLLDAAGHLVPGGLVAVVVIDSIVPYVTSILEGAPEVEVVYRRDTAAYSVFHYRFTADAGVAPGPGFDRGVYEWRRVEFMCNGVSMGLRTAHDLPEHEGPSRATELLLESIAAVGADDARRCVMFNPGQGYAPAYLAKHATPSLIDLVDRDLLSLRHTRGNLLSGGYVGRVELWHQTGLAGLGEAAPASLIAGVLREDEGPAAVLATVDAAADQLAPGGLLLLGAGSTAATRVEKHLRSRRDLRVRERKRKRGSSMLVVRR